MKLFFTLVVLIFSGTTVFAQTVAKAILNGGQSLNIINFSVNPYQTAGFKPSPENIFEKQKTPSKAVSIRLRCPATTFSTDPLLVIDGVLYDLKQIGALNPNDIESIFILKDGSATALYGCHAAKGVIIINTKAASVKRFIIKDFLTGENKDAQLKKPTATNTEGATAQNQNNALNEIVVSGYGSKRRNDNNVYDNANIFRGQVRDANNNALPFANVTNSRDNVGTYSDAQGNFTLVSTDTVLDVQVRSLGFQNRNIQLRNFSTLKTDNRVILEEDRSLNAKILDTAKRNISRARNSTMTFEEPEPEDGWDSYGSYVVNNLNIPETFDMKKGGQTSDNTVEVSFEVNKNGEPVNIRIEKSLCDKCDAEAKRLIKEGPKWKRKAKKSKRTTVTVPFIKTD